MAIDILRRTMGYNYFSYASAGAVLAAGQSLEVNLASGPGEFDSLSLIEWSGNAGNYGFTKFKLVVDTVTVFDGYWVNYVAILLTSNWDAVWTANFIPAGVNNYYTQYKMRIPYESSCSFTWTADALKPISLTVSLNSHVYR